MEGWDGTTDGSPSDLTRRRWRHFGLSGAKLIWGGEAVAVRPEGRANPHQLMLTPATTRAIGALRDELLAAARRALRRARRRSSRRPAAHAFRPVREVALADAARSDRRLRASLARPPVSRTACSSFPTTTSIGWSTTSCAPRSRSPALGFQFVDVKHCHGYLATSCSARGRGRAATAARSRTARGSSRNVVAGIRATAPRLGDRRAASAFDTVPYRPGPVRTGVPETAARRLRLRVRPLDDDDLDAHARRQRARSSSCCDALGVRWLCVTGGSPYYCPHVQRPALFPPSDGYEPPEDPLVGVARQINVTRRLKAAVPRHDRSSAPATAICRSGCRTSRRR